LSSFSIVARANRRYDPAVLVSIHKRAPSLLRRYGLVGACAHVIKVIRDNLSEWQSRRRFDAKQAAFDRKRGIQTLVRIRPEDLNVIGPHRAAAVPYQPIGEESFGIMFAALIDLIGPKLQLYSFVDLGCGMGKALLLAAEHPFRQIVGVEFARALAAVCEKNLRADRLAADRRCNAITVVVADAARFSFPDGPLVVFLYNPFGPQVLAPVLENLRTAVISRPSATFVAYLNAQHVKLVEEAGFTQVWAENEDRIFKFEYPCDRHGTRLGTLGLQR
jgi:SAM-dependent methyltransferase